MKSPLSKLDRIRAAAKTLAGARSKLSSSVAKLTAKVDAAHRRHLPRIRNCVGEVADAEARLRELLRDAPEQFVSPRTITEAGIKCGYQGHDKSLDIPTKQAERVAVVEVIKEMFTAEQIAALGLILNVEIPATETLLEHCTDKQIEKLVKAGAEYTAAGDHLIIKAADAAIDKLVAKLLKAATDASKEEEAA